MDTDCGTILRRSIGVKFAYPLQLSLKGSRQWQSAIDVARPRHLVITAAFLSVLPAGPFAPTCKRFPFWKTGGWFARPCAQAASGRWQSRRNELLLKLPVSSQESRRSAVIFVLKCSTKKTDKKKPSFQTFSGRALRRDWIPAAIPSGFLKIAVAATKTRAPAW